MGVDSTGLMTEPLTFSPWGPGGPGGPGWPLRERHTKKQKKWLIYIVCVSSCTCYNWFGHLEAVKTCCDRDLFYRQLLSSKPSHNQWFICCLVCIHFINREWISGDLVAKLWIQAVYGDFSKLFLTGNQRIIEGFVTVYKSFPLQTAMKSCVK